MFSQTPVHGNSKNPTTVAASYILTILVDASTVTLQVDASYIVTLLVDASYIVTLLVDASYIVTLLVDASYIVT